MNLRTSMLTLMVALAAGGASAAGTHAGTEIRNTATATFTHPDGTLQTAASTEIKTTVLAKAGFDVEYVGTTPRDGTTASGALPNVYLSSVMPGGMAETPYQVVNTGNVNNYEVTLTPDTTGTGGSGGPQAATNVKYYVDANGNGALEANERTGAGGVDLAVTKVTVPADNVQTTGVDEGVVQIIQVITVPGTAATSDSYAASPRGTAAGYADGVNPGATVTEAATDLQFTRVVVTNITNSPNTTPGGNVTPPGTSTPTPGYTDPSGTVITSDVTGDRQTAYPRADSDASNNVVTFINTVSNGGGQSDAVNLFPTGAGVVNNGNGTFTLSVPGPNGTPTTATVRFLDAAGQPLPTATVGGTVYPVLTVAPNGSTNYRVEVTYPDYDSVPGSDPAPITVVIGVDSGNDADVNANDVTTDVIFPAQLQFGDATPALGTAPDPAPTETVVLTGGTSTTSGNVTDRTAIFPMDIANPGEYADTYQLSGHVDVPVSGSATPQRVPVRYFIDNGTGLQELTRNASGNYVTGVVDPNKELKVWAVIDIPTTAAATPSGTTLKVQQSVTSTYSGITRTDTNDQIVVDPGIIPTTGNLNVTKRVDKTTALPGDTLIYTVGAVNNFNKPVKNLVLTEVNSGTTNVFTWTNVQSVSATASFGGTVLYRFNGGAWQGNNVAPAQVTQVDVGVDTNGDQVVDTADLFPAGAQLTLTLQVQVK